MRCLADTELIQLIDGSLPPELGACLEEHIDHCESCFQVVATVLRGHSAVHRPNSAWSTAPEYGAVPAYDVQGEQEIGRRYLVLELIGQGGMGQVYRALDRLTGQTVALKRVLRSGVGRAQSMPTAQLSGGGPQLSYARCLEQEFRLLATLRHPNIISVIDYGFDEQLQPFFTMDLLAGARPILPLARSLPEPSRIELLIQLLHALSYLHRRGVLHRDLKPKNLQVVPKSDGGYTLKVVDFGLSSGPEQVPYSELCGTLAYMAPELLRGQPASEASDLYAAAMVAYEVLCGDHPFAADGGTTKLLFAILREPPDLSRLPAALAEVLGRTLSKRPSARPPDAATFLRELCAAVGIERPFEPPAVRDSFLVAARFVGREAELEALAAALRSAQAGHGAAWLLSGESGAGKSRLLEELRSLSLPQGVLVLRGQAVQSGGTAYSIWQDVLRLLALHVELDPHEMGLLAAVVPDLPAMLERPRALTADPQSPSFRLLGVLLDVLQRPTVPTLVLLEDLQWADVESLQLLSQLSERLADKPMLIVASFREEEAPSLPAQLPAARCLRLPRLDRPAMRRLCASILGTAAPDMQLLARVERETEGNTYFLIEWMRALAAAAGSLDEITSDSLPAGLLPGSVAEVLRRRLRRVPEATQPLLQLAAVAGRQLDPALLRRELPQLDAAVHAAAEAGVLEAHGAGWRFSHDKLREGILSELAVPARRVLHLRVARSLEAVYPHDDTHAAAIAYHYHEAQELGLAASRYVRAGEAALLRGAPSEAEGHFERAIEFGVRSGASRPLRAQSYSGLAQARYAQGRLQGTFDALKPMFSTAGTPLPDAPLPVVLDIGKQLYRYLARRKGALWNRRGQPLDEEERQVITALQRGMLIEEVFVWMARPDLYLTCLLRLLNLDEALDIPPAERHIGIGLLFLLGFTPLRSLATRRLLRSQSLVGRPAVDHQRTAAMIWLNAGNAAAAVHCAERAVAAARAIRDDHSVILSLFQLQLAVGSLEDYGKVLAISEEMEVLSVRVQNRRYLTIALIGQAMAWMRFGDLDRAAVILDRARINIPPDFGIMPQTLVLGQSALCALQRGDSAQAEALAGEAMAVMDQIPWALLPLLHVLAHVLEVYLTLPESRQYLPRIRVALRRLEGIGRAFPLARPRAYFYRGRYELWSDNPLRAQLSLRRSVRAAQEVGLRFEEAQAREWLARLAESKLGHLLVPEGAAVHWLTALSLYERCGANREVARLRSKPL